MNQVYGRLFENYMRISAAETEGTDAGDATTLTPLPLACGRNDLDGYLIPRDIGIAGPEIQVRGNLLVLKREHNLDEPGNSGCGFKVAEIGFDRSDRQPFRAFGSQYAAERVDFNGIAQGRACTVRFNIADLIGKHASVGQRFPNHCLLREAIRRG